MIEKEYLNFLKLFLKKYCLLNLKFAEVQTGQIFDRYFEGGKLSSDYVKVPSLQKWSHF